MRYLPDEPLPPYAYLPGRNPHPIRDPSGHSYGKPPERAESFDGATWRQSKAYLRGIDLFNHGFFWEAHEFWEGPWKASAVGSPTRLLLEGLIRLAAARLKAKVGEPRGATAHAAAAADRFRRLVSEGTASSFGLELSVLIELSGRAPNDDVSLVLTFDGPRRPGNRG